MAWYRPWRRAGGVVPGGASAGAPSAEAGGVSAVVFGELPVESSPGPRAWARAPRLTPVVELRPPIPRSLLGSPEVAGTRELLSPLSTVLRASGQDEPPIGVVSGLVRVCAADELLADEPSGPVERVLRFRRFRWSRRGGSQRPESLVVVDEPAVEEPQYAPAEGEAATADEVPVVRRRAAVVRTEIPARVSIVAAGPEFVGPPAEPGTPFRSIGEFERMLAEYEANDVAGLALLTGFSSVAPAPPAPVAPVPQAAPEPVRRTRPTLAQTRKRALRADPESMPEATDSSLEPAQEPTAVNPDEVVERAAAGEAEPVVHHAEVAEVVHAPSRNTAVEQADVESAEIDPGAVRQLGGEHPHGVHSRVEPGGVDYAGAWRPHVEDARDEQSGLGRSGVGHLGVGQGGLGQSSVGRGEDAVAEVESGGAQPAGTGLVGSGLAGIGQREVERSDLRWRGDSGWSEGGRRDADWSGGERGGAGWSGSEQGDVGWSEGGREGAGWSESEQGDAGGSGGERGDARWSEGGGVYRRGSAQLSGVDWLAGKEFVGGEPPAVERFGGGAVQRVDEWVERVPAGVGQAVGARLGVAVGDLAVRRGPAVGARAAAMSARAFSVGGGIYLPDEAGDLSETGAQALVAHELVHVVQQQRLGAELPAEQSSWGQQLEEAAVQTQQWFRSQGASAPLVHRRPGATAAIDQGVQLAPIAASSIAEHEHEHESEFASWTADPPDQFPGGGVPEYAGPASDPAAGRSHRSTANQEIAFSSWSAADHFGAAPAESPADDEQMLARLERLETSVAALEESGDDFAVRFDQPWVIGRLADRLYATLRQRLRSELLIDRERRGTLADLR
ncbi:DUF4157 domain-containing protein [Kribbella sp. NPDC056861]|uniref:eCIS core domain-containing protein n=1 Tax=Kribbella sp. NPDC056861 TaxID=3154857 RepID=UPI0034213675